MHRPLLRAALPCLILCALAAASASAQSTDTPPTSGGVSGNLYVPEEVRRQLREQREQLEEMRATLKEQARLIEELRARMERAEQATTPTTTMEPSIIKEAAFAHARPAEPLSASAESGARRGGGAAASGQEAKRLEDRVASVEAQAKKTGEALSRQLGSMTFSGDLRFRYESLSGQQNALATAGGDGDALGNPLSSRQRLRLRARFGVRGRVGEEFEWGLRLATGSFPDVHSTNQTLTDFFSRKNFALEQAFIAYKPSQLPGLRVQAGKFETPWLRTEMTWDNDNTIEGLSESYTRTSEKSRLRELAFVAWQAPLLERNAAFVLNPDGTVNQEESGRAGRDLALYGAQLRARVAPTEHFALTLSAADLYFSGTQFISPAQFFGANIQLPVNVTIPASGTTPARTVTAQVSVPRELLVGGNSNLGFSSATTNALNRDGRLASGYNLVDLIARFDLTRSRRWPLMLLLNFVTNTQARDVVSAGPGGADVVQRNGENRGFWAEFQIGRDVLRLPARETSRGDVLFNYTFLRIEKDAVLTPFNFSDLSIFSDVRGHRLMAAYAVDSNVVLALTSIFSQRPNGLLGPFAATPPGSLNRTLTRLQLDTILRF
ncbi:MAG TPA: putative porin [Pyrinomonadaceae bacterium]|nr:putative porin [Pyrinomonadaceae bacterium]